MYQPNAQPWKLIDLPIILARSVVMLPSEHWNKVALSSLVIFNSVNTVYCPSTSAIKRVLVAGLRSEI